MFGSLGPMELLLIAFIVLMIFGARRLPEAGAGLGKAIRSFKDSLMAGNEPPQRIEPPPDRVDIREDEKVRSEDQRSGDQR